MYKSYNTSVQHIFQSLLNCVSLKHMCYTIIILSECFIVNSSKNVMQAIKT